MWGGYLRRRLAPPRPRLLGAGRPSAAASIRERRPAAGRTVTVWVSFAGQRPDAGPSHWPARSRSGCIPTALAALPANDSDRTPRELVAAARASAAISHEGYAETTGTLGLPDLPRLGEVAALLGGTTHARVWWRSPAAWRVDRVTATGESGIYAWRGALHTWDYESRRARTIIASSSVRLPRVDDLLPPQASPADPGRRRPADR